MQPIEDVIAALNTAELSQPEPEVVGPSDKELLELMPRQLREDLATVSRLAVYGAGPGVTPGIFRVTLNTGALDFARAILQRYATPQPSPVPVAERPWEREGWCNAEGKCWFLMEICGDLAWELEDPSSTITFGRISCLPHNALPVPGAEVVATELRQEGQA
jgi:hypothetical protein